MKNPEDIGIALNQILEERDRVFPYKDPKNTKSLNTLLADYVNILRNSSIQGWYPNELLLEQTKQFSESPVFICGHMKSGTTLLVQLLDGHPELNVMPGDSHMLHLIEEHENIPYSERLKDWDSYWISRFINPTGQSPFWILGEDKIPYIEFLYYLDFCIKNLPESDRNPFLAVVESFYCANPKRPPNPKHWVEKTPGNELHVSEITSIFPSACFIHIIRDLHPNLASMKRLSKVRGWNWSTVRTSANILKSTRSGKSNYNRIGSNRYHLIRFEYLLSAPESVMRGIANFLDITFSETLLTPTINGLTAKANSTVKDKQIFGGINENVNNGWQQELNLIEQSIAEITSYLQSIILTKVK